MINADFAWINFDETFSAANTEATRIFFVDDLPVPASRPETSVAAEGYVLVQAEDVGGEDERGGERSSHRILVNGNDLPSFDLVVGEGLKLWMDRIPPGFLTQGENRLTVRRGGEDTFRVYNIVVQWRERAA